MPQGYHGHADVVAARLGPAWHLVCDEAGVEAAIRATADNGTPDIEVGSKWLCSFRRSFWIDKIARLSDDNVQKESKFSRARRDLINGSSRKDGRSRIKSVLLEKYVEK